MIVTILLCKKVQQSLLNRWWESTLSGSVYFAISNASHPTLASKYEGWGGDFNTTQSLILNKLKKFTGEINFNYNFPTLLEGKTLSNYCLNLGVKHMMFHNKLITSLNIYNVLRSDMISDRITTQNITQSYNQYYDTQSVRLSISYKLGNKTLKVEEREGSNADEKGRTGN